MIHSGRFAASAAHSRRSVVETARLGLLPANNAMVHSLSWSDAVMKYADKASILAEVLVVSSNALNKDENAFIHQPPHCQIRLVQFVNTSHFR